MPPVSPHSHGIGIRHTGNSTHELTGQEAASGLDFGPSLRLIYQLLSYAFQHQALRSVLGAHR